MAQYILTVRHHGLKHHSFTVNIDLFVNLFLQHLLPEPRQLPPLFPHHHKTREMLMILETFWEDHPAVHLVSQSASQQANQPLSQPICQIIRQTVSQWTQLQYQWHRSSNPRKVQVFSMVYIVEKECNTWVCQQSQSEPNLERSKVMVLIDTYEAPNFHLIYFHYKYFLVFETGFIIMFVL